MQKILLILLVYSFSWTNVSAQIPYMEEAKALGAVSGQGLACNSVKYDNFELLARAIILSKSPSDSMQEKALYTYNEAKANAYFSKQMDGFFECSSINNSFDNQDIFNATLYANGTLKMPDGSIITPRRPYDATMIYKKNGKARQELQAIYNKAGTGKIIKVSIKDTTSAGSANQGVSTPAPMRQVVPVIEGGSRPMVLEASSPYSATPSKNTSSENPEAPQDMGIGHLKRR